MTYATLLIQKYRSRGIIIDTNLLLLLAVGLYDPNRITTFKRTSKFDAAIFEAAATVVGQFQQRYTTPYLIAELDNISRMLPSHEWVGISRAMQTLVPSLIEIYEVSSNIVTHALHANVGVSDCSIAMVPDALIFTDDLPLASRLQGMGREVLNISHLIVDTTW